MDIGIPQIALALSILGGGLGLAGYLQKKYAPRELTGLKEDYTKTCAELATRIQALEIKINPIWRVIEEQAFKGLKSNPDPTHVERDRLIDKYLSGQRLSRDEARFLARGFMSINEGKETGNKGLAVLGLAVLASKYSNDIEDMLKADG
jgi:hypothetical protein